MPVFRQEIFRGSVFNPDVFREDITGGLPIVPTVESNRIAADGNNRVTADSNNRIALSEVV